VNWIFKLQLPDSFIEFSCFIQLQAQVQLIHWYASALEEIVEFKITIHWKMFNFLNLKKEKVKF
jgi:hypothetical protein